MPGVDPRLVQARARTEACLHAVEGLKTLTEAFGEVIRALLAECERRDFDRRCHCGAGATPEGDRPSGWHHADCTLHLDTLPPCTLCKGLGANLTAGCPGCGAFGPVVV